MGTLANCGKREYDGFVQPFLHYCSTAVSVPYTAGLFSARKSLITSAFPKVLPSGAFSFAIFFLGMSAAFLGNVVEKDIHRSSLIAAICFAAGMAQVQASSSGTEESNSLLPAREAFLP